MKKSFKYRNGQRHLNYKGKDILIDADEFDKMSEDDVVQLIKNLTRQEVKKPIDDNLTPEEADEGFKKMREELGLPPYDPNKKGTFKRFIKGRLRDV